MTIVQNTWGLLAIMILFYILSSDPETISSQIAQRKEMSTPSGKRRRLIRTVIWIFIGCFYILSLVISYCELK